ncbi:MAG: hypothetical protein J6K39_00210 [Clostridia bacterium]|nr:hypothetical protein [Clostridia bacterium]
MAKKKKKILKSYDKKFNRKPNFDYHPKRIKKTGVVRHNDNTFIAVDSCILIDIERLFTNRLSSSISADYKTCLSGLVKGSRLGADGEIKKGKFVLMLLPCVADELSNYQGEFHNVMKTSVLPYTFKIEIADELKDAFEGETLRLVRAYNKAGLFLDEHGMPTLDGVIVAQASILNLNLISRDSHIVKNVHKKAEKIMSINRKHLQSDFNGFQARPVKLEQFFNTYMKGNPIPYPENAEYLSNQSYFRLKELGFREGDRSQLSKKSSEKEKV